MSPPVKLFCLAAMGRGGNLKEKKKKIKETRDKEKETETGGERKR